MYAYVLFFTHRNCGSRYCCYSPTVVRVHSFISLTILQPRPAMSESTPADNCKVVHKFIYHNTDPQRPLATIEFSPRNGLINFVSKAPGGGQVTSGWHGVVQPSDGGSFHVPRDENDVLACYGEAFTTQFRYKGPSPENDWFLVERLWEHQPGSENQTWISRAWRRKLLHASAGKHPGDNRLNQSMAIITYTSPAHHEPVQASTAHLAYLQHLEAVRCQPECNMKRHMEVQWDLEMLAAGYDLKYVELFHDLHDIEDELYDAARNC